MAIYFDMDGVMADFAAGVRASGATHIDPGSKDKTADDAMWEAIRKVPHFYRNLPEIPAGTALFRRMTAAGLAPEVLTAVPKPKRGMTGAAEDKIAWNEEHLGPDVKTHICYRAEKILKCHGPEDILIDDLEENIAEWRRAGGTGCLFRPDHVIELPPRIVMALNLDNTKGPQEDTPRTLP